MVKIQIAEPKDADVIYRHLLKVSNQTNNLNYSQKDVHKYLDELKISDQLHDNETAVSFIAFEDDEVIGLVQLTRKNLPRFINRGELSVSIDQDFWNQGVGNDLLAKAINWAIDEWHLRGIYLNVLSSNLRAINLYKKHGFKIVGDLPLLMTISGRDTAGKLMFKEIDN